MENALYFMEYLQRVWNEMTYINVPGFDISWADLIAYTACILVAISLFNRFTGTEGLGFLSSTSDSVSMSVKNRTLKAKQREAAASRVKVPKGWRLNK